MSEYSTAGKTIGDLKRMIAVAEAAGLTDDAVVIIAKDAEGNGFSPLADRSSDGVYRAESSYAGSIEYWDEDDVDDLGPDRPTWSEWYADAQADGCVPCLVLWPTN
jgi:hypothetical protein